MEQPRYTLQEMNFQSDKNYTDLKDQIVGFIIDKDITIPTDIAEQLSNTINNMLADHYKKTHEVLSPADFEVSMSIEMNDNTNKISINTYILNDESLIVHTKVDISALHDDGKMKEFFFNTLTCIVLDRIKQLQNAAE